MRLSTTKLAALAFGGVLLVVPAVAQDTQQLQAFSVVLVQGDQQTGNSSELPQAAQGAVNDVKDFLPFRSYRFVDSAWILAAGSEPALRASRMKGPDDQDVTVTIGSESLTGGLQNITFRLVGATAGRVEAAELHIAMNVEYSLARETYQTRLAEFEKARTRYNEAHPVVRDLQKALNASRAQLLAIEQRAEEAARATRQVPGTAGASGGVPLIETTFQMRLGETVVVGTSRIRGDKALIAVLTAVPRGGRE